MNKVRRLNHAVLYARDARVTGQFYVDVLGFEVRSSMAGGTAVFLRAQHSDNDHDLGIFSVGDHAPSPARGTVGLYHLAWQVETIEDLAALRARLIEVGSFVGESDHGVSKSVYAVDPDGTEFEIMWAVPADQWTETGAKVAPLQLDAEMARWAGVATL